MNHRIYIVGMGPGREEGMTGEAVLALEQSDVIVGYGVYLELLGERFRDKRQLSTPMKKERERCMICFEEAEKGNIVSMICSGDAGIYGMASLMYEIGVDYPQTELVVVAGLRGWRRRRTVILPLSFTTHPAGKGGSTCGTPVIFCLPIWRKGAPAAMWKILEGKERRCRSVPWRS